MNAVHNTPTYFSACSGGGKTTESIKVAEEFLNKHKDVLFISTEMSEIDVFILLVSKYCNISIKKIYDDDLTNVQRECLQKSLDEIAKTWKFRCFTTPKLDNLTLSDIFLAYEPEVLIIDHIYNQEKMRSILQEIADEGCEVFVTVQGKE